MNLHHKQKAKIYRFRHCELIDSISRSTLAVSIAKIAVGFCAFAFSLYIKLSK